MNIVGLVGRLTADADFRRFENQNQKVNYKMRARIAVDRETAGKDGKKEVDFIPVQCWLTEAQHDKFYSLAMKKGAKISVNGKVRVESWKDEQSQENRSFTCIEGRIEVVERAKDQSNGNGQQGGYSQPSGNGQQGGYSQPSENVGFQAIEPTGFQAIDDDDIPF